MQGMTLQTVALGGAKGHGCAPLRWMFQGGSSGEDGTVKKKAKLIEGNGTKDIATNIYE